MIFFGKFWQQRNLTISLSYCSLHVSNKGKYFAPTSSIFRFAIKRNCAISSFLGFRLLQCIRSVRSFSLARSGSKRYENEIQNWLHQYTTALVENSVLFSVSFWIAASALAKMHFVQIFSNLLFFHWKKLTLIAKFSIRNRWQKAL